MKKYSIKNIFSIVALLLIIGIFGYYLNKNWQDFQNIHIVSVSYLVGLIVLTPLSFYLTALFFKKSVEPYGLNLSFSEYFGLTMMTLMGNYLLPFSGLGLKAVYMKKKYKFTYSHFLVTVVANWITNFLVYTIAGILALSFYYLRTQRIEWFLLVIYLIVLAFAFLSIIRIKLKTKNKLISKMFAIISLWQNYLKYQDTIRQLIKITFWQFWVVVATFYCAYNAFGFRISLIDSISPTVLSLYSTVIRLVPASFGFYELSVVYPSTILGLTVAQGLSVSLITRVVTVFWIFVLGFIFSYILIRKTREIK